MQERWRWRWRWRWCKRKTASPPYHPHCDGQSSTCPPPPLPWPLLGHMNLSSARCLLTLIVLLLEWSHTAWAICPSKCVCNEETLLVTCDRANLGSVPITFNPGIRDMVLKNDNIKVTPTAFNFYKSLLSLDLASNKLQNISANSFEAQHNLQVTTTTLFFFSLVCF